MTSASCPIAEARLAVSCAPTASTAIQAAGRNSSTRTSSVLEPRYPQQRLCSRQIAIGGSVEVKTTQRRVVRHDGGLARPQTRLPVHGARELVSVELLATRNTTSSSSSVSTQRSLPICVFMFVSCLPSEGVSLSRGGQQNAPLGSILPSSTSLDRQHHLASRRAACPACRRRETLGPPTETDLRCFLTGQN